MNEKQKESIREALRLYVMKYPSQNKAAASLDGTSAGTISSVLSGKCNYEVVLPERFKRYDEYKNIKDYD